MAVVAEHHRLLEIVRVAHTDIGDMAIKPWEFLSKITVIKCVSHKGLQVKAYSYFWKAHQN